MENGGAPDPLRTHQDLEIELLRARRGRTPFLKKLGNTERSGAQKKNFLRSRGLTTVRYPRRTVCVKPEDLSPLKHFGFETERERKVEPSKAAVSPTDVSSGMYWRTRVFWKRSGSREPRQKERRLLKVRMRQVLEAQ